MGIRDLPNVIIITTWLFVRTSGQDDQSIRDQTTKMTQIVDSYRIFLNTINGGQANSVDDFQAAIGTLLPSIRSLWTVYTFSKQELQGSPDFDSFRLQFQALNAQINQTDLGVDELNWPDEDTIVQWYTLERYPIIIIQELLSSFSNAASLQERQNALIELRQVCSDTDPMTFFTERSSSKTETPVQMLTAGDPNRLMKWVKVITADAAHALTMQQACAGLMKPSVTDSQVDRALDQGWTKLQQIYADLKMDGSTTQPSQNPGAPIPPNAAEVQPQLLFNDIQWIISQFGMPDNIHITIHQYLTSKYPQTRFAAHLLNSNAFSKFVINPERMIEIPGPINTLVVFWKQQVDQNQQRVDDISQYLQTVPCSPPIYSLSSRSDTGTTMSVVNAGLSQKGVNAIYVTDGTSASIFFPATSWIMRRMCVGGEGQAYYQTIITAY